MAAPSEAGSVSGAVCSHEPGLSVTLFRIAGASSLLARELPSYPLGESAQYVVFIRNAAAAHPLEIDHP